MITSKSTLDDRCESAVGHVQTIRLKLIKHEVYENRDWTDSYAFEFAKREDVYAVMQYLQSTYGNFDDILCIWVEEGSNKLLKYEEYDTIEELRNCFTEENFRGIDRIQFSSIDRYIDFRLFLKTNTVMIYSSEGSLGKKVYDPAKVVYLLYKDSGHVAYKFDGNEFMVYYYDKPTMKWMKARELRYLYLDREEDHFKKCERINQEQFRVKFPDYPL